MNTIILWLESPWQLRALVFALSFFVCFVAPWLHNQSLLTSRIAARKPLEEKSETVSVPKAEVPHQDAEVLAKVPAPQEQTTLQEKAATAAVEENGIAQHEPSPSKAEAQVPAMQAPAEAPVPEEQASVPVPVAHAPTPAIRVEAPASAQVEPHPEDTKATAEIAPPSAMKEPASAPAQDEPPQGKTRTAVRQELVTVPEQAPVEVVPAPAMKEIASGPAQVAPPPVVLKAPAQNEQVPVPADAPVVSEPKAPVRQEQAEVQAPAPSAASKAQSAGGFKIVSQSAGDIPVPAAGPVEKQGFVASTESGGSAEVEVYVLSNKAGRNLLRSNRVVDQSNGRAELSAILDSDVFAKAAARYDTVACVGLGSRSKGLSTQEITRLTQLCGAIARKPFVSMNTKLYGLPLGLPMNLARPEKERARRSLIIIGLRNTKGDLTDASVQKQMVSEIIRGGRIANFPLSDYSEVASGKALRYIEVKGGNNNRPIKLSAVKPSYAIQRDRLASPRHKPCGASGASRTHLTRSKKVSRSHANAETPGRKTHQGCGLFDFPF
jgi:hypothetical protein